MIYPTETGRPGELLRLPTLERVWIQGKLRMWGRWSFIGSGRPGNMFNQLLSSKKVTQADIKRAVAQLRRTGISVDELHALLADMQECKNHTLVNCTDSEAMTIDKVVGQALEDKPALIALLHRRYDGRGRSKKELARELAAQRPEWCLRTCETRIDVWLSMAEYMLYVPMRDAFDTDPDKFAKFRLQVCAESV